MGRIKRIIYRRKIIPYPLDVCFIEPEWEADEIEQGRYRITAKRWGVLRTCTGWSKDAHEEIKQDSCQLCEYLLQLSCQVNKLLVVGHQLNSIVTLLNVSQHFREQGWYATHVCRWDERFMATITDGQHEILWRDLQNWLPGNLPEIAAWLSRESEEVQRFSPGKFSNPYHWGDTLSLVAEAYDLYRVWVEVNFDFQFHHTLAGLALALFSQTDECRHIVRAKEKDVVLNERRGYFGGFCIAHQTGDLNTVPHHLLDANGLYAAVERDEKFPYYYCSRKINPTSRDLDRAANIGECLVHGIFSSPAGFLPIRRGNFLSWQQEKVDCWLPWPEFSYVEKTGTVHELKEVQLYRVMPLFNNLVGGWIKESEKCKREGEKYERRLWKSLCNSLYGKFAQRMGTTNRYPMNADEQDGQEYILDAKTHTTATVERWCGSTLVTYEDNLSDSHFPSVAAWVTSHARKRLFSWCAKAGWENTCYNDTDSLIVTESGLQRLRDDIDPIQTGKLKIESSANHCWIGGNKRYSIGNKIVNGGLPKCHYVSRTGGLYWTEREEGYRRGGELVGALYSRVQFRSAMASFDYNEWLQCIRDNG